MYLNVVVYIPGPRAVKAASRSMSTLGLRSRSGSQSSAGDAGGEIKYCLESSGIDRLFGPDENGGYIDNNIEKGHLQVFILLFEAKSTPNTSFM